MMSLYLVDYLKLVAFKVLLSFHQITLLVIKVATLMKVCESLCEMINMKNFINAIFFIALTLISSE